MEFSSKRKRIIEILAVLVIVVTVLFAGTHLLSQYTVTSDESLPREWIPVAGSVFIDNKLGVWQQYAYRVKGREISEGDERRVIRIGYIMPVSAAGSANKAQTEGSGSQPDK